MSLWLNQRCDPQFRQRTAPPCGPEAPSSVVKDESHDRQLRMRDRLMKQGRQSVCSGLRVG